MIRVDNWHEIYIEHVLKAIKSEYKLGVDDCATFVADFVSDIIGVDIISIGRNKYDSEQSLSKLIIKEGSIREQITKIISEPNNNPKTARKGDVIEIHGIYEGDDNTTIAICDGATALHKDQEGLSRVSMDSWVSVWHI